jgi:hypothetical protein
MKRKAIVIRRANHPLMIARELTIGIAIGFLLLSVGYLISLPVEFLLR